MRVTASQSAVAVFYTTGVASLSPPIYIGVSSADPGTTVTPASEASGGSPAYGRVSTSPWTAGTAGVQNGTQVSVNMPAGTWAWMLLCTASTGNNMWDNCSISSTVLSASGPLIITPTITVT